MKQLLPLFIFSSLISLSQVDFNNYKPLKCQGKLPKVFTVSLEEQVKSHQESILEEGDKFSKKRDKKKFALAASYNLLEMVLNGQVLFGDELSEYVNEVAENVLVSFDFSKKSELEFFVVKSPYVNAFTTDEGKIFVSVGLLAQLETEAQLAYILCHEMAHFQRDHVLSGYLFNKKVNKKSSSRYSSDDALLKKSAYSQDKELEADSIGYEIFSKSPYGASSLLGVFDVLQFAHLPIDDIKFNPSIFENENYKIQKRHLIDTVNAIEILENKELSTHPSSEKRAERIEGQLEQKPKKGKHFILGEKTFKNKRNIARFELSQILLDKRMYQALLYNNYVLSKDFKNSFFLSLTNSKALYFLTKYKTRNLYDVIADSDYIQGESQSLYNMVEHMGRQEFGLLSVNYIWENHKKYPNNDKLKELAATILREVIIENDIKKDLFIQESRKSYEKSLMDSDKKAKKEAESTNDSEEEYDDSYTRSSKYKKIKKKIKETESGKIVNGSLEVVEDNEIYFIFGSLFKEESFSEMFDEAYTYKEFRDKKEEEMDELRDNPKAYKKWRKNGGLLEGERNDSRWNDSEEEALGLNSIIFVDPLHIILDDRKKETLRIESSTIKQKELSETIINCGNLLDLDIKMLDTKDLKSGESDKFNHVIALNKMIKEINIHNELDSIVLSDLSYLKGITERYGTSKVAWNVMLSYTEQDKTNMGLVIGLGVYVFPTIPFLIYDMVTPDKSTFNFFFVFDIETGEMIYNKKSKIIGNFPVSVIKQNIYHNLSQLKKEKK